MYIFTLHQKMRAACPGYRRSMRQFFSSEHRNRAVDYKIFRFLIELKLALGMGPKDMLCNRE